MKRWCGYVLAGALLSGGCAGGEASRKDDEAVGEAQSPFLAYYELGGFKIRFPGATTHADITEAGLWFLKADVAEDLGELNELTDTGVTAKDSVYHGDNCRWQETSASVRERYDRVVTHLALNEYDAAMKVFGTILHTTQDLYAHSNWVEAGMKVSLTAQYPFEFPSLRPGDRLGAPFGSLVVLEQGMPDWPVSLPAHSRLPTVQTPSGTAVGLITGTYVNEDGPSACLPAASIPHGELWMLAARKDLDQGIYLTKDAPDLPYRDAAIDRAEAQTTQELCRLGRLLLARRGKDAYERLVSEWVADRADYERVCGNAKREVTALTAAYWW